MSFSIIELRNQQKVNKININNSKGPKDVVELQKTQKTIEIQATKNLRNSGRRGKVKKKGFFGDGEARGVDA